MIRTNDELRSIRNSVSLVGRLSDGIVRLGPLSLGVDGVLSWIPGVGEIYSFGAGAFILVQGARAGVPGSVLARAGLILGARTLGDIVPLAGPVFADLFMAHRWAANMVVESIDRQLGEAPTRPRGRWWRPRSMVAA